jgi:hypothetical protein
VRSLRPPYTLAKAKDVLEQWAEGEDVDEDVDEDEVVEVAKVHLCKQALKGLKRWQRLQEPTPQTLTAN